MIRMLVAVAIVAMAMASACTGADRSDGCYSDGGSSVLHIRPVAKEAREQGLRLAGYAASTASALSALEDSRPDVRSLAAQELASTAQASSVEPSLSAWLSEKDTCTKAVIRTGLDALVGGLARDVKQHPGGQRWVTPFQACTPPELQIIGLTVRDVSSSFPGTVLVTLRNLIQQPVAFAETRSPEEVFSVTVLDPGGARAKIQDDKRWLCEPLRPNGVKPDAAIGYDPTFLPLLPGEETSFYWHVADDFDMSAPGVYQVSLGGRVAYLDTTVCSNSANVVVQ